MKAAVLFETQKPLRILEDVTLPPLAAGQVEVEIAFSGVCHSQLMEVQGKRGEDRYLPHLLGHEATGIVRAIGSGVTKVAPGDAVILGWIKGDGQDVAGALYDWHGTTLNSGGITTFSERSVVSENRLTKLPDGLPMDLGVLFGCAVPTGAGMAQNEFDIQSHHSVVVFGIGGIGAISLMYANCQKPKTLIAVDINPEKRATALDLGATHALDGASDTLIDDIVQLTDGLGADLCIDAAGRISTIEIAFQVTRRNGGQCVFASHPEAGQKISIDPFELINGKNLKGSWGGKTRPDQDLPRFFELFKKNDLPLESMITKRYSLDAINDALDDLASGRVMRPLIEINPALAER
ncbi:zinc-binding dehydrogenase [Sneathiella sp.]|jgi:S-(hydroxymethyl)glutathione dehydrogenase/alcohol dehydrogenase|uniref:zinc-binding dehydrogenase n=1 Tax=Sneathiella sp. TaxID=1964365 RepID=UPI0039E4C14D